MLLADGLATNLFLVGLAVTVVMFLFRGVIRRRTQDAAGPPAHGSRAKAPRDDRSVSALPGEVEIHDVARELTGRIDTKLALLETLIRDARREGDRLEALLAEARLMAEKAQAPRRRPPAAAPGPPEATPAAASVGSGALEMAPMIPTGPSGGDPAGASLSVEERFQSICSLADSGCDLAEIARRVRLPVGEVELILGLRDKG
jgi:hypothetical protein